MGHYFFWLLHLDCKFKRQKKFFRAGLAQTRFSVVSEAAETKNAGFDVQTRGSCP